MYIYVLTYVYVCIYVCMYVHMQVRMYHNILYQPMFCQNVLYFIILQYFENYMLLDTCVCVYTHVYIYTRVYIYICIHIYIHTYIHIYLSIYVKSRLFYGTWLAWQRRKASISHFLGAGRAKAGELNVKVGLAFRNCNIICYEGPVLEFSILDGFDKASIRGSKWSGLRL